MLMATQLNGFNVIVDTEYVPTGIEATPTMTAPTTPSGYTASASHELDANTPAWKAFDKSFVNYPTGLWYGAVGTLPGWVQLQFPSPVWVASYELTARNEVTPDAPKDFILKGSSDGVSFTDADTRTAQTGWSPNETRSFTLPVPMQFAYWRLHITATTTGGNPIVQELKLFG